MLMSRLSTDAHTECEDRARILKQNSQLNKKKKSAGLTELHTKPSIA